MTTARNGTCSTAFAVAVLMSMAVASIIASGCSTSPWGASDVLDDNHAQAPSDTPDSAIDDESVDEQEAEQSPEQRLKELEIEINSLLEQGRPAEAFGLSKLAMGLGNGCPLATELYHRSITACRIQQLEGPPEEEFDVELNLLQITLEFNRMIDEQRFGEIVELGDRALDIAPADPIAQQLYETAAAVYTCDTNWGWDFEGKVWTLEGLARSCISTEEVFIDPFVHKMYYISHYNMLIRGKHYREAFDVARASRLILNDELVTEQLYLTALALARQNGHEISDEEVAMHQKIGELACKFSALERSNRCLEAFDVAQKAKEIAPDDPIVLALENQAKETLFWHAKTLHNQLQEAWTGEKIDRQAQWDEERDLRLPERLQRTLRYLTDDYNRLMSEERRKEAEEIGKIAMSIAPEPPVAQITYPNTHFGLIPIVREVEEKTILKESVGR